MELSQNMRKRIKCLRCGKNYAIKNEHYGWLPCKSCQLEEENIRPKQSVEFTTDFIKDSRREYAKDILQPWRDGVLSKEFVEEYGTTGVVATESQVKNARYTNKGQKGWWQRGKSKGGLKK